MKYQELGYPCRNFCIMASETFMDPLDNRQKFAVSSFVAGGTGIIAIIDVETGEGERIELPADEGAWALYCLNNERLMVGTCAKYGYLHGLDLKTRTWLPSLRDEKEKYFWNLVEGTDGRLYGGTWPGGVLLRYDPIRHELKNMGRMSDEEGNNYTRPLYSGTPGKIFLTSGYKKTHMVSYDIEKECYVMFGEVGTMVKEANKYFVCGINDKTDTLYFFDPYTLMLLGQVSGTDKPDGSAVKNPWIKSYLDQYKKTGEHGGPNARKPIWQAGKPKCSVAGQSYVVEKPDGSKETKRIPVEAPPTAILTVAWDGKGKIWGSSAFGQTIFSYDPKTFAYMNTTEVANAGGEVYGIVPVEDRLYLTSYVGGEHVVYRPGQPFDKGVNPKTIKTLSPDFIRPHTRSVRGADGNVWTGWMANYGTYGGAISKIDVNTDDVTVYADPIEGQGIESIAAGKNGVFFATTGSGNGLPNRTIPLWLAKMSYDGQLLWKKEYDAKHSIGAMAVVKDHLYVRIGKELVVFDTATMETVATFDKPATDKGQPLTSLLVYDEDTLVVFHSGEALFVKVPENVVIRTIETHSDVRQATVGDDGQIYFGKGSLLCKLGHDKA